MATRLKEIERKNNEMQQENQRVARYCEKYQ